MCPFLVSPSFVPLPVDIMDVDSAAGSGGTGGRPSPQRAPVASALAPRAAHAADAPGHVPAPRRPTGDRRRPGAGEWGERVELHGDDPEDPHSQTTGSKYFALDVDEVPAVGGSRPDRLPDVSGPQERVQRRTAQQTTDIFVPLPMLDALVPQAVVQLVEVLRPCDMVPEQVIEAPKITSQDVIPARAMLRVPQMAEQLVETPTVPCLPQGDDDSGTVQRRCRPLVVPGRGTDGGLLVVVGAG